MDKRRPLFLGLGLALSASVLALGSMYLARSARGTPDRDLPAREALAAEAPLRAEAKRPQAQSLPTRSPPPGDPGPWSEKRRAADEAWRRRALEEIERFASEQALNASERARLSAIVERMLGETRAAREILEGGDRESGRQGVREAKADATREIESLLGQQRTAQILARIARASMP